LLVGENVPRFFFSKKKEKRDEKKVKIFS